MPESSVEHAASSGSDRVVPEPEPAHLTPEMVAEYQEREATELGNVGFKDDPSRFNSRVPKQGRPAASWFAAVKKVWANHVAMVLPHEARRDHLANERTFLAYMRTSAALSMLGVAIAQLYRLDHVPNPSAVWGYYLLSIPMACLFQGSAAVVLILGAIRFLRQQGAMARGRAYAGGWEIFWIMGVMMLLLVLTTVIHISIDIYKDMT